MAGRTNRPLLRVQSITMTKPKPGIQPQTSRTQISPRRPKGVTTKPKIDPQKQIVTKLCECLLGESFVSDNAFSNCQDSMTKLELLKADILLGVPWAKDVSVQNSFIGLTRILLREYQKQENEIEKIVTSCNEQRRLMEYKGKQIKELQNKHEIQILAKEEEKQSVIVELNQLLTENQALHEENNKLLENYQTQLQLMEKSEEEKYQEKLQNSTSSITICEKQQNDQISNQNVRPQFSESTSGSLGCLSRETTKKSFKSDSSPCVSLVSFANTGISTVSGDRETSDMTELSFANSTQSEEIQTSCLMCSNEFNTTQVFLCIQCIEKFRRIS